MSIPSSEINAKIKYPVLCVLVDKLLEFYLMSLNDSGSQIKPFGNSE